MKAPAFWWFPVPTLSARLLAPLATLYGAVAAHRLKRPAPGASIPVLCVGNVTAGGAGKTPTALALARALMAAGARPGFVTRGHGGSERGPYPVDPARDDSARVGDEALLLAAVAPTIVARDRGAGVALLARQGASIAILDDGLQNRSVAKGFTLAVFDGAVGFGNGMCLPAGPLRAPLDAQAPLIDAGLIIGQGPGATRAAEWLTQEIKPTFRANVEILSPKPAISGAVLAFCGIGRPEKFFDSLAAAGIDVRETRAFADHHRYSDAEADALLDMAKACNLALVTTEKDLARLGHQGACGKLRAKAHVLPIEIRIPGALIAEIYRVSGVVPSSSRRNTASGLE